MFLSPDDWVRHGKGSVFQFSIGDDDFVRTLELAMLPAYAPYSIIGTYKEKREGGYVGLHREVELRDFIKLKEEGLWQFFVKSKKISSGLVIDDVFNVDSFLAVNGLINIQHGRSFRGSVEMSSIGVVGEVVNIKTGIVRRHAEYVEVYKKMRKMIASVQSIIKE